MPAIDHDIQIIIRREDLDADAVGTGMEMLLNPINGYVEVTARDDPIDQRVRHVAAG